MGLSSSVCDLGDGAFDIGGVERRCDKVQLGALQSLPRPSSPPGPHQEASPRGCSLTLPDHSLTGLVAHGVHFTK